MAFNERREERGKARKEGEKEAVEEKKRVRREPRETFSHQRIQLPLPPQHKDTAHTLLLSPILPLLTLSSHGEKRDGEGSGERGSGQSSMSVYTKPEETKRRRGGL